MKLRWNREIGLYSPGWQLKFKLAGQVHMLAGNLPEWISGGSGRTIPMNWRTSVSVTTNAFMEPMIDNTPGDCWQARSSLLGGRQRDPLGAAGVIDYALSYGTVHVADILYDKQSLS
jgi:hypothetical protein